jgi:type IV pilus assembly protein PilW
MNRVFPGRQRGLSLVELMLATALALLVMTAASACYLAGRKAIEDSTARMARLQSIQFALATLTQDIGAAGTFGCAIPARAFQEASGQTVIQLERHYNGASETIFDTGALGLRVVSANGTGWLSGTGLTPVSPLIQLQFGQGSAAFSALELTEQDGVLKLKWLNAYISRTRPFPADTTLLALASCRRIDFIQRKTATASDGHSLQLELPVAIPIDDASVTSHHQGSLELMRFVSRAYLVASRNGRSGLYQLEIDESGHKTDPLEIAPGISGLELEFGVCSEDGGTAFQFTQQPADWRRVVLARLTLRAQDPPGLTSSGNSRHPIYHTSIALHGARTCQS